MGTVPGLIGNYSFGILRFVAGCDEHDTSYAVRSVLVDIPIGTGPTVSSTVCLREGYLLRLKLHCNRSTRYSTSDTESEV